MTSIKRIAVSERSAALLTAAAHLTGRSIVALIDQFVDESVMPLFSGGTADAQASPAPKPKAKPTDSTTKLRSQKGSSKRGPDEHGNKADGTPDLRTKRNWTCPVCSGAYNKTGAMTHFRACVYRKKMDGEQVALHIVFDPELQHQTGADRGESLEDKALLAERWLRTPYQRGINTLTSDPYPYWSN